MTATDIIPTVIGGGRVLVVSCGDDDSAALTALLRLRGFDARAARSGAQAVSDSSAARPRVVVLDPDLPDLDGCEVVRRLRAAIDPPEVVVLSADTAPARRRAAVAAGASAYLLKPAEPVRLVALVRELSVE